MDKPMKWHRFLCCFALWAGAILYGGLGEALMGTGRSVYVLMGLGLIIISLMNSMVAFLLIRRRWLGVKLLLGFSMVKLAGYIALLVITATEAAVIGLVLSCLMLCVSWPYYMKRKALFTDRTDPDIPAWWDRSMMTEGVALRLISTACFIFSSAYAIVISLPMWNTGYHDLFIATIISNGLSLTEAALIAAALVITLQGRPRLMGRFFLAEALFSLPSAGSSLLLSIYSGMENVQSLSSCLINLTVSLLVFASSMTFVLMVLYRRCDKRMFTIVCVTQAVRFLLTIYSYISSGSMTWTVISVLNMICALTGIVGSILMAYTLYKGAAKAALTEDMPSA